MNRQEAMKILDEWVKSPNLRKHMLAVAASMEFYANYFSQIDIDAAQVNTDKSISDNQRYNQRESAVPDRERWWIAGLLHDLDYEKFLNPDRDKSGLAVLNASRSGHPYKAVEFLKDKLDQESLDAILSHASYTKMPREMLMAKTLFAVDELTGMIVAVALVKPDKKLSSVDVKSVKKRFKEKRFAAGVNREEIIEGAKELGAPLDEHIQNVIDAMKGISPELGL